MIDQYLYVEFKNNKHPAQKASNQMHGKPATTDIWENSVLSSSRDNTILTDVGPNTATTDIWENSVLLSSYDNTILTELWPNRPS